MSDAFDPYYIWLGIPPDDQPPHHYRLLGVALFEENSEVIEAAANRQMAYMQEVSAGEEHIDEAQKLLGELSKARVCLLNSEKKAAYDAELRASFDAIAPAPKTTAEQTPAASATPTADDSLIPPQFGLPDDEAGTVTEVPTIGQAKHRPHATGKSKKKQGLGPIIGLAVVLLILLVGGIAFFLSSRAEKFESERTAEIVKKEKAAKIERQAKAETEGRNKEEAEQRLKHAARQKAQAEAKRKAKEAAKRKAAEDAKRQAEEEVERKAKAAAEQQAREEAASDAEQVMTERKLERDKNDGKTWFLRNDQASEYEKLQSQPDSEQIEKLESLHNALLQRYAELADDDTVKNSLKQLGGKLATGKNLPFWPETFRDELGQLGLFEQEGDDQTVWILVDEQTLLGTLETLESQKAAIIAMRKKSRKTEADAAEEKTLVKEFDTDWKKVQDAYKTLNEKYKNLDTTALKEKTAQLGSTLGPTLDEKTWKQKLKSFNRVTKRDSRSKPRGKVQPFFEFNETLALDGTDATQNAFTGPIAQPSTITAEVVVRVKQGRKYGAIVGRALDNGGTEQGWQLGYNTHVFQWRVGAVGGRFLPQAESKTGLQGKKVHHVVGTYNGQSMKLYVDGELQSTKPKRGRISYPDSPFIIGGHVDNNEYLELNGTVYLVRVYAGALSDAQVRNRYNEVKGTIDELNN